MTNRPSKPGRSRALHAAEKIKSRLNVIESSKTNTKKRRQGTMSTNPTYEQAQLHLQIYEMRREPRLRQARDWFFKNYFADNIEEAMRIAPPGTEAGTFVMMVFSYWDQACALLNYGLLHEDLFFM